MSCTSDSESICLSCIGHRYQLQATSYKQTPICNLATPTNCLPLFLRQNNDLSQRSSDRPGRPCPGSMSGMASSPSLPPPLPPALRPRTQKGPSAAVICLDREQPAAAPEAQKGEVTLRKSFYGHAVDRRGPWARPRVEASHDPVPAMRSTRSHLGTRFITTGKSMGERAAQWTTTTVLIIDTEFDDADDHNNKKTKQAATYKQQAASSYLSYAYREKKKKGLS